MSKYNNIMTKEANDSQLLCRQRFRCPLAIYKDSDIKDLACVVLRPFAMIQRTTYSHG